MTGVRAGVRGASRPVRWAMLTLLVCVLSLTGCVEVPTTGPPEKIEGQAPPCQNCVNVEVAPPTPGEDPDQIVEGYLRATGIYQSNYAVAKQFLTEAAAETWSPEDGAQIYSGSPVLRGRDTVVMDGRLEGALGPDRTYTARNEDKRWTFSLVSEDGEWRISKPPPGLMIADNYFARFYQTYNLYFLGNGSTLVPDPIYLPSLPSQANVASVLMKSLLSGPSKWLRPAVSSQIPADTALSVDSVTVTDGVATVPLSEAVLPLSDPQRSLLTAQVVYTLRQATGIQSVLFTVNSRPFQVPEGDPSSFEVAVDSVPVDVEPVPFVAADQLYGVSGQKVQLVGANTGAPDPRPMAGPLGAGRYAVDSLGVSVTNTDIAVVTDGRTTLRSGLTTATGALRTRLTGATRLLRPQFSRYGELWAIGEEGGRQRIWMFSGDKPVEVGAPVLEGGRITAFRISPDGSRMAVIREVGNGQELGLARITRGDKVTVDGWRALDLTQPTAPAPTKLSDVGWLSATELLVLGATSATGSSLPYRVSEDASQIIAPAEASYGDAGELTVLLGAKGASTSVLIGRDGHTLKFDGAQWLAFVNGFKTMAFPG